MYSVNLASYHSNQTLQYLIYIVSLTLHQSENNLFSYYIPTEEKETIQTLHSESKYEL